ncbi:MAG: AsmA family protein [Alphaproteobacteria bacterium]|nr:AsmA family protein [Alphaproteobacteria bacterium]
MRWVLRAVLVVIGIVTLAVAVLVYLVPSTALERHILAATSRATDTLITSAGKPQITLFPSIAMTLKDVTVRPRTARKPALQAKRVEAEVGWLSILTAWTVNIDELRIIEPVLEMPGKGEIVELENPPAPIKARRRSYPAPGLAIGKVTVLDGTVRGLGENWRIKDVDAKTDSLRFDRPINLTAVMFLNGEKVDAELTLKNPGSLKKGDNIPLTAKITATPGSMDIDGVAALGDKPSFHGRLQLDTADLGQSTRWLGFDIGGEFDKTAAALDGQVAYLPGSVIFQNTSVDLTAIKANVGGRLELGRDALAVSAIEFGDFVRLNGGPKTFLDLDQFRMTIDRLQPGSPLKADFAFFHNDKPVSGSVRIADLDMLTDREKTPVAKAIVSVPGGKLEFDGSLLGGGETVVGKFRFSSPDLRQTATWLGVPLPDATGYRTLALDGDATATTDRIDVSNSKFKLDEVNGAGDFNVDLSGKKAAVRAKLDIDAIDTAGYLAIDGGEGARGVEGDRRAPSALTEAAPSPPYDLDLEPIKPTLEAYLGAGANGPRRAKAAIDKATRPMLEAVWSQANLGLAALKDADTDAEVDITVGDLRHGDIALGRTSLKANLKSSTLALDIREVRPLDGRISGTVKIDASSSQPAIDADLEAAGVPLDKVIKHGAGQRDIMRGTLTGKAKLKAKGTTQSDLVASLDGNVSGEVRDGAIVGYDIRRIVRPFASRQYNPRHVTAFETLKGRFKIADGVAQSPGLSLDGPGIRIRASGSANLQTSAIDYRSRLDLIPPPSNFSLPLKIRGTWNKIKAAIDWGSLATAWTGASPFEGLETTRRSPSGAAPSPIVRAAPRRNGEPAEGLAINSGDRDLDQLLGELVAKSGGARIPTTGAELMREITGKGR